MSKKNQGKQSISISFSPELLAQLDIYRQRKGYKNRLTRSEVVHVALSKHLNLTEKKDVEQYQVDILSSIDELKNISVISMELIFKILKLFTQKYSPGLVNDTIVKLASNVIDDIENENSFYDILISVLKQHEKHRQRQLTGDVEND